MNVDQHRCSFDTKTNSVSFLYQMTHPKPPWPRGGGGETDATHSDSDREKKLKIGLPFTPSDHVGQKYSPKPINTMYLLTIAQLMPPGGEMQK